MRAIMISIKPEFVEKILNGEKTIEIRKTKPKCELPCKVYIYCTKAKNRFDTCVIHNKNKDAKDYSFCEIGNGKVVAEFTLDDVGEFYVFDNGSVQGWNWFGLERSCLTYEQISEYVGFNKKGYAWHIDSLKIYDKPKELSEFAHWVVDCYGWKCKTNTRANCEVLEELTRPPQSWCYVEKVGKQNERD